MVRNLGGAGSGIGRGSFLGIISEPFVGQTFDAGSSAGIVSGFFSGTGTSFGLFWLSV